MFAWIGLLNGCRNFSNAVRVGNRFTREEFRHRLQKQNLKDSQNKTDKTFEFKTKDEIPVRPVKDLYKCLGFTLGTSALAFTTAIVVDLERSKRNIRNYLFSSNREKPSKPFFQKIGLTNNTVIALIGMNIGVFALWKVPALKTFMWRYFTNSFASKSLCVPMLTSVFSHSSAIHLALNMYVATTFVGIVVEKFLGHEQFWSFFVAGGVFSSLTSLAHKAVTRNPIRALGASGAIIATLAYTCMRIPDAKLSIVFVPGFEFSAQSALWGMIAFDLAGLIFRFRMFDHAAHLGGALFGIFYSTIGQDYIWIYYGELIEKQWTKISP
ncbi:unnamed protein product [Caenorhabditis auriculariae]|uniref:rhomboid protease n=1 Tax=Caenorhabditis auriculariae TaxID=2777116 RepID=A0A8S1H1H0_9PELO|nr:unnamed protein product [Caenorhabditis auriculariae]